tara:strand:+ start:2927 stop:3451 length:525 start_codon:yes stop_codon:yes gene_type:complete
MNIFILDEDPGVAAMMMCDKHVPKMILESGQMLSSAHRILDGDMINTSYDRLLYKIAHKNHPCTKWVMESAGNYKWLYDHFITLGMEFEYRRDKIHATITKLGSILKVPPNNIPKGGLTEFVQAMKQFPDCMVEGDAVQAYRNYYHASKPFAAWEWKRQAPAWWEGYKGADLHS